MNKRSFVGGAVILGAAGVLVKLMGAVFRIPVTNWLGPSMAYYTAAYPIYNLLLTLSVTGIPVAVSRMIAERTVMDDHYAANHVLKVSIRLLACIGISTGVLAFFGAGWYAGIVGYPEAGLSLRSLTPALMLVPVMSAYRGYFQGLQNMKPTALSQITEQFFRVSVGLFLTWFFLNRFSEHPEYAAAGATFGASAGAIGGLLVIWGIYMASRKSIRRRISQGVRTFRESDLKIMKTILVIAIPITIGACVMPIMNLIDASIVSNRLQDMGFSYLETKKLYTELSGMSTTIFNFPQVLLQGIAVSIVPAVSMAYEINDMEGLRENVRMGVRMANMLSFPCTVGLMVLAGPILLTLYPNQAEMARGATPCLMVLSVGLMFLVLTQMLTGVLQGIGRQNIPVRNLFIGAGAKVIVTYILVGIELFNVKGAAIGTIVAYTLAVTLNYRSVKKFTGVTIDPKTTIVRPAVSALLMGIVTFVSYRVFDMIVDYRIALLISIFLSVIAYGLLILKTKTVSMDEIALMPKGDKLAKVLKKFIK